MNLADRMRHVEWDRCRAHPGTDCPAAGLLENGADEIERLEKENWNLRRKQEMLVGLIRCLRNDADAALREEDQK